MEIKKGYKMTDVGVIPEDWEVITLDNLGKFSKGAGISKSEANSGTIKAIRYGELYTTHDYIIKRYESFISQEVANKSKKLIKGDIVFACSGETKEEIGKCAAFIDEYEVYAGGDIIIFSPTSNTDSCYLGYILNSSSSIDQKSSSAQGDSVVHVSADSIRKIQIPMPDFSEQQAIADALTKVDNLIMSLSKVIEKKKLIKKGAMQKLLSGEMRLDGFEGEWIKIKLGDISSIKTGSRNVEEHSANGKYPFFVRSKEVMKINTFSYDEEAILVPGEGGIGEIFHYVNGKFDVHQRVYKISDFNDKVNALFIYWYMIIFFGEYAKENTVKATVDSLRLPTFTDFICCLPPTKAEQTAIAKVLTTMDNEIEALEKERDKYKCIKQGMMQQLLTGKIRLICQ